MSVAKEIGKGTLYNALAKYAGIVINLVVTGVLARILSADAFGVVALTTVVITFFDLLGNMGFGPAIIQNKELDNKDLASIFNLTIIIAIALAVICIISAPYVAKVYDNNDLLHIMQILSLQVFFTILNVVPYSLLLKAKQFKLIATTNVTCQLSFGALAVLCALSGLGIYSLLIAPIGTIITAFFIYSIKTKKLYGAYHCLLLKAESIKKVLTFSIYQFLFNIVNYFSRNLDKLLIGNRFSMTDLGYYEKSYRLMQLPISNISSVMSPTIQPVLSQYQNDRDKLTHYTYSVIKILAYIGLSITPLLFFCARDIILIAFGPNWEPAVPIFQILALSVFAQVVDSSAGSLLQAANAPKFLFYSGLICAVLNVSCIILGVFVFKSMIALAWALDVAFFLNLVIDLIFICGLTLKTPFKDVVILFAQPLVIAIVISVSLWIANKISINNIVIRFCLGSLVTIIESVWWANRIKMINLRRCYSLFQSKLKNNEYYR